MKKIQKNILSWCENPEQGAVEQAINITKHPCFIGHVCLMPDTHQGYGMPIGGVVALEDAVCPNMVGVDIGCGMLAVKTSLTDISRDEVQKIIELVKEKVPVGFNHHQVAQEHDVFNHTLWETTHICQEQKESAHYQIGTLGGGNHFIEIQKGDDGHIWFMIHSGSRNLGKRVAEHYNQIAVEQCRIWRQNFVIEKELAFLPAETPYFHSYIDEMNLCLEFSRANRDLMAKRIKEAFEFVCPAMAFEPEINIHHNYAACEKHFRKNVWVHRKGATLACQDTIGIIPGSQGTKSYIVQGKGNEASLCSCSHGAGRRMSRIQARKRLDLETERALLDAKGIIHAIKSVEDLDEASSAYKDINTVMNEQKDLVNILVELTPLGVIKG